MKYKFSLLLFFSQIFVACNYEKTAINLGSNFDETWSFSDSQSYEFNTDLLEVIDGKAQLKALDLNLSSSQFATNHFDGAELTVDQKLTLSLQENSNAVLTKSLNLLLPNLSENLMAHWSFDSNYNDSSGNALHGAGSPSTEISSFSRVGQGSLRLTASDGYVRVENSPLITGLNKISFGAWVWLETPGAYPIVMNKCKDNVQNVDISFRLSAGNPSLNRPYSLVMNQAQSGNWSESVANSSSTKNWRHIVSVYDGLRHKFYLDGQLESDKAAALGPIGSFSGSDNPLIIGHDCWLTFHSNTLDGFIDEAFIYNTDITAEDIQTIYKAQSTGRATDVALHPLWTPKWSELAGYWRLDETPLDSSGHGHHATIENGALFSSKAKVGGHTGLFDGDLVNLQHMHIANTPLLEDLQESDYTISAWFKAHSTPPNNSFDDQYYSIVNKAGFHLGLAYTFDGLVRFSHWQDGDLFINVDSKKVPTHEFIHVVGTANYTTQKIKIYVNGELQQTANFDSTAREYGTSTWFIGLANTSGLHRWPMHGQIDEVALWQTALTEADVKLIYNKQKQKYSSFIDSPVIDTGSDQSAWPDLGISTELPFGKELVGDVDNNGSAESETAADYSSLTSDFSFELEAYYAFNQSVYDGTLNEIKDLSGNAHHGYIYPVATTTMAQGILNTKAIPYGSRLNILAPDAPTIADDFTLSFWIKGKDENASAYWSLITKGNSVDNLRYFKVQTISGTKRVGLSLRTNGLGNQDISSLSDVLDGNYHHVVITSDGSNTQIYVNGKHESSSSFNIATGEAIDDPTSHLRVGELNSNTSLDEVAFWNRPLSASEVLELYRRGANRVYLQVKSCIDPNCFCESYNTVPLGNAADCDGDGTPNELDNSDNFKAKFIGPGGDGTTFFSERMSRDPANLNYNCGLNTTDSHSGVCVEDEIQITGSVLNTKPIFNSITNSQFVFPAPNRFSQLRVYMEADDNTSCAGAPCLPTLQQASFNNSGTTLYSNSYVEIKPKSPIVYSQLLGVEIKAEACASFRLSRQNNLYYHNSIEWVLATNDLHRNTEVEVENNLMQFSLQYGPSELEVIGYLKSDTQQNLTCFIDEIDVSYQP